MLNSTFKRPINCWKCGSTFDSLLILDYKSELKYYCEKCSKEGIDDLINFQAQNLSSRSIPTGRPTENSVSKAIPVSDNFERSNHFTDCGIEFPTTTFCGIVFNDIFKHGLSFNKFENKYKQLAKSHASHSTIWKSCVQYNLQVDVWGPKEAVVIFRGGKEKDASVVYAIRNPREFGVVDDYLKSSKNVELLESKPGTRIYNVKIQMTPSLRNRQVVIYLLRETEQSAKITLMLNF
ncbi:MAG: hypothetical protein JWR38_1968 [Mucilaginibacter sp.]|nr:hypothetical protein [Mucilaginibacter sp.]